MNKKLLSDIIETTEIESESEWMILSYMIISNEVLFYVYKKYKANQIKTKHFTVHFRQVFRWLIKYWSEYKKAPNKTIKEIFNSNKNSIGEENSEVIEIYLDRLSEEYENLSEEIDSEYIINEVIPNFQKNQEAELIINQLQTLVDNNDLKDIEKVLNNYSPITEDNEDSDLGTVKPGSIYAVRKYFSEDKKLGQLFRMPGAIGQFIGPIYRSKFYAVSGIEKSGKTYFLQEIGRTAANYFKLKVLDINLEMSIEEKEERYWQREANLSIDKDHSGKVVFPVFDCVNNQFGTCKILKKNLNKEPLLYHKEDIAAYKDNLKWITCTKCRDQQIRKNAMKSKRFIPAIWFKTKKVKPMTERRLKSFITNNEIYGLANYRIKCFPRFSATLNDVIDYIKRYSKKKNYIPDLIILDYPDILAPVDGNMMDRLNIDYNWKKLAGLSQELNIAILGADQAVKAARGKRSIGIMDTGESKTKDAHLDMRLTLNKTSIEEAMGLQRLGMLFRRKGKLQKNEIMMTQRLETGNVILDSEWWFDKSITYQTCITNNFNF